jgi:hypothetical protein
MLVVAPHRLATPSSIDQEKVRNLRMLLCKTSSQDDVRVEQDSINAPAAGGEEVIRERSVEVLNGIDALRTADRAHRRQGRGRRASGAATSGRPRPLKPEREKAQASQLTDIKPGVRFSALASRANRSRRGGSQCTVWLETVVEQEG